MKNKIINSPEFKEQLDVFLKLQSAKIASIEGKMSDDDIKQLNPRVEIRFNGYVVGRIAYDQLMKLSLSEDKADEQQLTLKEGEE